MTIRIAFIGDTLLGGQAQDTLAHRGYRHAFSGIAPALADADLVVANLEGPITAREQRSTKPEMAGRTRHWYRALPASVPALVEAGVGIVSLANNHVTDFGAGGLRDTLEALDENGIVHCGAGLDEAQARRPAVAEIRGRRIGFLSFMQRYEMYEAEARYAAGERAGTCLFRPDALREEVARLDGADLRIALVHWGRTYRPVTPLQERLAAALRDAGIDLVIGHHPHIPQRIELRDGCPVLYSLGNGPFGAKGRFAKKGHAAYGLVATVETDGHTGIDALELGLIRVDNRVLDYRPEPADDAEGTRFLWSLVADPPRWRTSSPGRLRTSLVAAGAGR
jgi:poly-gamma-glutamate synthesis protein (capsule biosynthesis protein)